MRSRYQGMAALLSVCSLALALVAPRTAQAQELITNGGFESNGGAGSSVFTGWTETDQANGSGSFAVQTGTASPLSGFTVPAPPEGTFAAMSDQGGPGSHVLIQNFVVPFNVTTGILNFQYFLQNFAGAYFNGADLDYNTIPNEQARVDILTGTAGDFSVAVSDVLFNAFQTNPGDPLTTGYNPLAIDVTSVLQAHAGETLRLRFAEVDNQSNFNFGVDTVSLQVRTAAVPEPGSVALILSMTMTGAGFLARRRKNAR